MLTVGTQNKSWYGCSMVYYHPILITTWKADAKIPEMVFCCVGGIQADLHTELSYKHILQLNVMLQQSHVIAILIIWFFKMLLQNNEFSLSCFWDRIKSPWNLLRVKKFQLPFSICVLCRVSSNWKARHRSTHTHTRNRPVLHGELIRCMATMIGGLCVSVVSTQNASTFSKNR